MTQIEMHFIRETFDAAAIRFGWRKKQVTKYHERDEDCSWEATIWVNEAGQYLFDEEDIEPGLAEEFIKLAKAIPER